MTYGAFIAARRKAAELTQDAVAERVADVPGLKQSHISMIERDQLLPDGRQAAALADALSLTVEERVEAEEILRRAHLRRLDLDDRAA